MQETIIVQPDELLFRVNQMREEQYRLVQISVTKKESLDLLYSFAKDLELVHLRLDVAEDQEIESISHIYSYAFLYENELKDLFDVKVRNITVDFKGNLYKIKRS